MNEIRGILLLAASRANADLVERALRDASFSFKMKRTQTRERFLEQLAHFDPDLILAAADLPRFDVMMVLQLARERAPRAPVVLIAESVSEETAVRFFRAGAADCVLHAHIARLAVAVAVAWERQQERNARDRAEDSVRVSEADYGHLFEHASYGIFRCTLDGRLTAVNPALVEMLRYESPGSYPICWCGLCPRTFALRLWLTGP